MDWVSMLCCITCEDAIRRRVLDQASDLWPSLTNDGGPASVAGWGSASSGRLSNSSKLCASESISKGFNRGRRERTICRQVLWCLISAASPSFQFPPPQGAILVAGPETVCLFFQRRVGAAQRARQREPLSRPKDARWWSQDLSAPRTSVEGPPSAGTAFLPAQAHVDPVA